jgi:ABC-type Fe3+/spermidine/putrescine transport system ATPase subunit
VAHFLSESNLEAGRVLEPLRTGAWRVDAAGLSVVATGPGAWQAGDRVAVLVRPERVRLCEAGDAGAVPVEVNAFVGRVEECTFRGASRRYRVRLPHGRAWSVDEPTTGESRVLPPGASVYVSWRPEDCLAILDG